MFLDELYDAYLHYMENKRTFTQEKFLEKQFSKINQKIYIRDLVVRTRYPNCYGESKNYTKKSEHPSDFRLRKQIDTLFNLANQDHIARNCDKNKQGKLQLKKGKENHITRLSTHEFSLFTAEPLTIDEYQRLYTHIVSMASELMPNVHILLSSFALKDVDGKLLNMSIFVEGGQPPVIHAFSKNTASTVDINYNLNETIFSQQATLGNLGFHAENITTSQGQTISTGSVFEVTTHGGAKFTQAIDVCLDHELGHSKALLSRRILSESLPDEILPKQVEQCVTSNWIPLSSESAISDKITHIDPTQSMYYDHKARLWRKMLTKEAKNEIIQSSSVSMKIVESETGYKLIDPPFGSNCIVEVLEEREAGKYSSKLQQSLVMHNDEVRRRCLGFIQSQQESNPNVVLIVRIAQGVPLKNERSIIINNHIAQVEKNILKKCRYGFFERIFRTEAYVQKKAARKMIESSFATIRDTIKKNGDASILTLPAWKKDLVLRLELLFSLPCQLKESLNA